MFNRWLVLAMKIARKSTHPHHHLGCIIVKGGSVIARAANLGRQGRCAERRALRPHQDLKDAVAYVVRTNGGTSRPCCFCRAALQTAGISHVVFIDEHRRIVKEAVCG